MKLKKYKDIFENLDKKDFVKNHKDYISDVFVRIEDLGFEIVVKYFEPDDISNSDVFDEEDEYLCDEIPNGYTRFVIDISNKRGGYFPVMGHFETIEEYSIFSKNIEMLHKHHCI